MLCIVELYAASDETVDYVTSEWAILLIQPYRPMTWLALGLKGGLL